MGDMKDKMKGFMKKVSSSSSSSKFKGQGRVLGTSSPSSSSSLGSGHPLVTRQSHKPNNTTTSKPSTVNPNPLSHNNTVSATSSSPIKNRKPINGFDPYDSLITSAKTTQNGYSLNIFECPICAKSFTSSDEVSLHVDSCVNNNSGSVENRENSVGVDELDSTSDLEDFVGVFLSGKPPASSVEVVLRLFKNIVREPENVKFRRIRMSNPKIKEAIVEVTGGIELLELVGFELKEEDGETWAVAEAPTEEKVGVISKVIMLLEPKKEEEQRKIVISSPTARIERQEQVEPIQVDRQTRVFFSIPENVAAKIEVSESFYKLSLDEVKREAEMRKKKNADSQLLIPKSFKEKQAKAARKKYTRTVIRIQFPDGVVLQGLFSPLEPTTALYEFVSSALKEPCLEFELLHPVAIKRRVIPHFPVGGEKAITLDQEDLVPSALLKFRPNETDSIVFTGLCNELLEISEPLV